MQMVIINIIKALSQLYRGQQHEFYFSVLIYPNAQAKMHMVLQEK